MDPEDIKAKLEVIMEMLGSASDSVEKSTMEGMPSVIIINNGTSEESDKDPRAVTMDDVSKMMSDDQIQAYNRRMIRKSKY